MFCTAKALSIVSSYTMTVLRRQTDSVVVTFLSRGKGTGIMGYSRFLFDRGKVQPTEKVPDFFVNLHVVLTKFCYWTQLFLIAAHFDAQLYCALMNIHGDGRNLNGPAPNSLITIILVFTFLTVFRKVVTTYVEFHELLKLKFR